MARGRSRAERERLFHEGRCMAPRCRQVVKNGDGSQFLEEDGTFSRLCPRCTWDRMNRSSSPDAQSPEPISHSA